MLEIYALSLNYIVDGMATHHMMIIYFMFIYKYMWENECIKWIIFSECLFYGLGVSVLIYLNMKCLCLFDIEIEFS